jgi:beta-glucosidase
VTEYVTKWNESTAVDEQVEALLGQFTLEQKIDLVTGDIEVPGIPRLTMADGPAGVRVSNAEMIEGKLQFGQGPDQATAMPAPLALAATWDPDLARQYGDVLGAEAFATGYNVLLTPAVDIARAPLGGGPSSPSARARCCKRGWSSPRSGPSRRTRSRPASSTTL